MEHTANAAAVHDENPAYGQCRAVLEQERKLVAQIAGMQALIRQAVINRQWPAFESHMEALNQLGAQFKDLDQERVRIFSSLSGGGDTPKEDGAGAGFYALVSRFPPDERKAVTGAYRSLKTETMKVRIEGGALMNYLSEASLLIAGFLEAAFPDRKGRIYSRSGVQVQADMRSMVLDRHC
ncbi:MAG: hypothetical protein LBP81_00120 [Treponema sp.]|jgi:hypothetical protein|nr:hypothetical protein [Treponema sp.]